MIDTSSFQGKKAAYYTLGCKLNFAETSTFGEALREYGVLTAEKGEKADICLINTCSVTEVADRKCRHAIRSMVRQHPGAFVVVTGCYAQLEPTEVSGIEGVNLVLGSNEKARLIQYLSEEFCKQRTDGSDAPRVIGQTHYKDIKDFSESCSRGNRTRYFLKVQDGCNHFCTYCTIPFARGTSRNAPISFLVGQAEEAARRGGKEIVITGVNIGDFGRTTGETFLDLVKALDAVEGIERYRISSIEPELLTDELIEYCAKSRAFMPHFHIPLQSGSDEVLRLMHRRYDSALFRHKAELIKRLMPDAFIGVDVMVGTRGETPELFEESRSFIESLGIAQLHVFPYSERPGTAALKIPYIVSDADKRDRVNCLLELSDRKTEAFYRSFVGQCRPVLLEKPSKGRIMHGFTDNYIRVELPLSSLSTKGTPSTHISADELDNTILSLRLGELNAKKDALRAEVL